MTKDELIALFRLDESGSGTRLVSMSVDGESWKLYVPGLDWVETQVQVMDDGNVRITEWPRGLYGPSVDRYITYEEVAKGMSR